MNVASTYWVEGCLINCLAVGNQIKHPPAGQEANVVLVDICVDRKLFPRSYLKYLANVNYEEGDQVNVLGVLTVVDVADDSELFLDYWNVFAFEKDRIPDWLTIPIDNLGKLFVKRKYEQQISLLSEIAKQMFVPDMIVNRMDLQQLIQTEIAELISPKITESIKLNQKIENDLIEKNR